jgi:hypothetical protein
LSDALIETIDDAPSEEMGFEDLSEKFQDLESRFDEVKGTASKKDDSVGFINVNNLENRLRSFHEHVVLVEGKDRVEISTTVNINKSAAGAVTASTAADDLTVESSGDGGISVLAPDANKANLYLGTLSDSDGGIFRWDYAANLMTIGPNKASSELALTYGPFTEGARLDASGKFGIGTNDPAQILHIQGSNPYVHIQATGGSDTEGIYFYDSGSTLEGYIKYLTATNDITFGTNAATERMRIDSSGKVGINEAAPGAYLEILNADASSAMTALFVNVAHNDPAHETRAVAIQDRGTGRDGSDIILDLDFSADKTVGGAYFIRCQDKDGEIGSCKADGGAAVAWNTSSDYRIKENLRPTSNALGRLNALSPQDGNFVLQPDVDRTFLVAHEIQEAGVGLDYVVFGVKDAVLTEDDIPDNDTSRQVGGAKHQQVNLGALTPLMIAGIKELSASVELLKSRVAQLEAA